MKVPADYRYHCHNRPAPKPYVIVQDGWKVSGTRRTTTIENAMSKDCHYAAHGYADSDPGCSGCKWMPK